MFLRALISTSRDCVKLHGVSQILWENDDLPPIRLEVRSDAQSHCGLGSGTQLSLAAAEVMMPLLRLYDEVDLAISHANRGKGPLLVSTVTTTEG